VSALDYAPRLDERTAEDWRTLLFDRLEAQRARVRFYEDYYDGTHPLQFATGKYREAFGALFSAFADNWCQLIVDSAVERLKVVGFQIGGDSSDDAWEIWQRNALDSESVIAHTEAGKCGRAYLLVDPNDGEPRITVEHPEQVIVAHDPADRRKRLAALKKWLGDDGFQYVTLYLPDAVFKWESTEPVGLGEGSEIEWVEREGSGTNVYEVVPMIPLENKPGLLGKAHSDLEPAIQLQNAVNKLCSDLIVTSEYGAFPQRVATGVEVIRDPETGKPVREDEQTAAMSRLWKYEKPEVTVTSLPAADLSNFVVAIDMLIQHLAAQTRTPPHYLLAKMVNASGDALSTAEAGLVSKCKEKQLFFSDAWEEAIALALGGDVGQAECEAIWANPERVSQTQLADAAVKKKSVDVPEEMLWLELGYTPEQIGEMKKQLASQQKAELERTNAQLAAAQAANPQPPQGQNPGQAGPPTTGGNDG